MLTLGKLKVVFEGVDLKASGRDGGGDAESLLSSFFVVGLSDGSWKGGSQTVNNVEIKESWDDGTNTVSIGGYPFRLADHGTKMVVGDRTLAVNDSHTVTVAKDGAIKVDANR